MAEKKGLVAWGLPYDRDVVLGGQRLDFLTAVLVARDLIIVHEKRAVLKFGTPLASTCYFLRCLYDPGERIAGPGIEVYDFNVERQSSFANNIVQKLSIGLFRFALAS